MACPLPMPRPAPVTITTRPSQIPVMFSTPYSSLSYAGCLPVTIAQHALVDLSVVLPRQLVDEVDRSRALEPGQPLAAEGDDLGLERLGRFDLGPQLHDRL